MQLALDAAADGVLRIPAGTYLTGPLTVPDRLRLELLPGAILKSNSALLTGTQKLLNVAGESLHLVAYGGRIEIDRTGFASEHNHAVSIVGASGSVCIEGLEIDGSGGDGIYVKSPAADVVLRDVRAANNRRQGLSVVECRSLTDYRGQYSGTNGTAPACGVDIEPNGPSDVLGPIRFYGTVASGNDASGFLVFLYFWNATTNIADIEFNGCVSEGNGVNTSSSYNRMAGFEVRRVASTTPCGGSVRIVRCTSRNDGYAGMRVYNKDINGPLVEIVEPFVVGANQNNSTNSSEWAGIVAHSDGAFTTTPGRVRVQGATIAQGSGHMTHAMWVAGNGGGHDDVVISAREVIGSFPATSAISCSSDEKGVGVSYEARQFVTLSSATTTLTDGRFLGKTLTNEGAGAGRTVNLMAATANMGDRWEFTFQVRAAQSLTIAPDATSRIYPIAAAAGDAISSSTVGSSITLRAGGSGVWYVAAQTGAWA
jgi:hypothetical protein